MSTSQRGVILAFAAGLAATSCGSATDGPEAPLAPAQADLSTVASMAASCSGCHASGEAIISLDGLSAEAISTSLRTYRSEDGTTVMHRMARGFTDEQIDAIADYLANQAVEPQQ